MSLPHAILGFLQYKPMTGYDLKAAFDSSVSYFWPADQAQIYRTLDKLAEQGFVESQLEIQENRPNRKVFSITAAGQIELARWLETPQPQPILRDPLLIQIFFGAQVENNTIFQLLEEQLKLHQAKLAEYKRIPLPTLNDPGIDRTATFYRLTLEFGLRLEEAHIEWLHLAIQTIRKQGQKQN